MFSRVLSLTETFLDISFQLIVNSILKLSIKQQSAVRHFSPLKVKIKGRFQQLGFFILAFEHFNLEISFFPIKLVSYITQHAKI